MGDIRGVDFRLVISQNNGLLINVDRRPYRLKTKAYNHDYSATVKTCHTADVKSAGGFSMSNSHSSLSLPPHVLCYGLVGTSLLS